ncbi:uncharacterized protein LOC119766396 [Culex quinquefasciatus]|uniref:uncharacterized protein LOC119766396 n=1 Tax=Culex quinquefasciatus TaxID=7176 RepID=UPI0018E2B849|nr:uncharacterized protein LOC119766396 [Culex quinquefasciatus]
MSSLFRRVGVECFAWTDVYFAAYDPRNSGKSSRSSDVLDVFVEAVDAVHRAWNSSEEDKQSLKYEVMPTPEAAPFGSGSPTWWQLLSVGGVTSRPSCLCRKRGESVDLLSKLRRSFYFTIFQKASPMLFQITTSESIQTKV